MSEDAVFTCTCDVLYLPEDKGELAWNDPDIGIIWPGQAGFIPLPDRNDDLERYLEESIAIL